MKKDSSSIKDTPNFKGSTILAIVFLSFLVGCDNDSSTAERGSVIDGDGLNDSASNSTIGGVLADPQTPNSSTLFSDACENGQTPSLSESMSSYLDDLDVTQVFCDEFNDQELTDQLWIKEDMHGPDHSVGHDAPEIRQAYSVFNGRRWSAFYDKHQDKTAYIAVDNDDIGVLIQRGILDYNETDLDKDSDYEDPDDPDNKVNLGKYRMYTSFLKTFGSDENQLPLNPNGRWGPGHFFEIKVNFKPMKMGGHRHSFWLMPALIDQSGKVIGTNDDCRQGVDDSFVPPLAYDCSISNGVEIDIYEYEAAPESVRNKLYMKVIGGKLPANSLEAYDQGVGSTVNSLGDIPSGIHFGDNYKRNEVQTSSLFHSGSIDSDIWHTVGLYWGDDRLVWFLDGKPVVMDTKLVPKAEHYLLLTREMNSGVRDYETSNRANEVVKDLPKRPADVGLAGENVGLKKNVRALGTINEGDTSGGRFRTDLNLQNKDYVKTDYVRVWKVVGRPQDLPTSPTVAAALSDILLNGNVIRLANYNNFLVRNSESELVCKIGNGPCQLETGIYEVVDIDHGVTYQNVVIQDTLEIEKSISFDGKSFHFPRGQSYQVLKIEDNGEYNSICNDVTICPVEPGDYKISNHASDSHIERFPLKDFTKGPISVSDDNVITWPDSGWYEVQKYPSMTTICEGVSQCKVEPGDYVVINHIANIRYEINVGVTATVSSTASLQTNHADPLIRVSHAQDFRTAISLLDGTEKADEAVPLVRDDFIGIEYEEKNGKITIRERDLEYTHARDCPSGGAMYYYGEFNPGSWKRNHYYDNCHFLDRQVDGYYLTETIIGDAVIASQSAEFDLRVKDSDTQINVAGDNLFRNIDRQNSEETQFYSVFDVAKPEVSYAATNLKLKIDRFSDLANRVFDRKISSSYRLTSLNTISTSYLVESSALSEFERSKNRARFSSLIAIDSNRNRLEIRAITNSESKFEVTLQDRDGAVVDSRFTTINNL